MNVRYNAGMYIENKKKRIARRTEEMKRNEANKGEVRAKKKREERLLSHHGYTKSTFVPRETMRTRKGIVCVPMRW